MNDKNTFRVYNKYFAKNVVTCNKEESDQIIQKYEKTGEVEEGYSIEKNEVGYRVWKDEECGKSIEEMKAIIEVEQAMNVKTIKKCVVFFTVCFILEMIVTLILVLAIKK